MDDEQLQAILNTPVTFGLAQQGHLPKIRQLLAAGESWEEIGNLIGWDAKTAREHYERLCHEVKP